MTVADLEDLALQLEPPARAKLAHRLLESLDALSETEVEALWVQQAERRLQALEAGELESIPADEVFQRVRERLR